MSVSRTLNSKAATWTAWGLVAAFFTALFLYANHPTIAGHTGAAKPASIKHVLPDTPGAFWPTGTAPLYW
jgi:hypothetical protein